MGSQNPWAADAHAEIILAAVSLFIADSNIRWTVSCRITATDATPSRGGAVSALVYPTLAKALWASGEQRGRATTLRKEMIDDDAIPAPAEIADVFKCTPWNVTRNRNFPETQHVNLQELAEIVDVVDEASRRTILPQRDIKGTDSMVSLCAVGKGRSSSHLINGHLRRFAARSVAGHKALSNTNIGTLNKVADYPSRDVALRDPLPAPDWLEPLLKHVITQASVRIRVPREWRAFREVFARCCRLSQTVLDANIPTARPLEAYPSHDNSKKGTKYIAANDLDDPGARQCLLDEIANRPYHWLLIGIPCTGLASMNQVNGGRRTQANPEIIGCFGSENAEPICRLCKWWRSALLRMRLSPFSKLKSRF